MHAQLIVVFVSGFLALIGIRILISSFDDNDGDGMAYSTPDKLQFSILEGSWDLIARCDFFLSATNPCQTSSTFFIRWLAIANSYFF